EVIDPGLDRQPGLGGASEVVERDRVTVVGVEGVDRRIGLLWAEVASGLVEFLVVEVPQQRRRALVELPVDDARRRGRGGGHMVDVGLELRALGLVVLKLGLLHVFSEARPRPIAAGYGLVELVERAEGVAAVLRIG